MQLCNTVTLFSFPGAAREKAQQDSRPHSEAGDTLVYVQQVREAQDEPQVLQQH